jgi:hypothetical protein
MTTPASKADHRGAYQVLPVSLATEKTPEVTVAPNSLYATLLKAGVEAFYDDRKERRRQVPMTPTCWAS